MYDTPGKQRASSDEGENALQFGKIKGSPARPESSKHTYDITSQSNSVLLETTVERGYTSSRLSRVRSNRTNGTTSGKLRFSSVDSESDLQGPKLGSHDVNEREILQVPVEAVEAGSSTLCCCLRLFGGSTAEDGSKKKKKSKSKKKNNIFSNDTTNEESTRLNDNLLHESFDPEGLFIRDNRQNQDSQDVAPIH